MRASQQKTSDPLSFVSSLPDGGAVGLRYFSFHYPVIDIVYSPVYQRYGYKKDLRVTLMCEGQ
jgi:hypothetical protein